MSHIIDYLSSVRRPSGGRLLGQEATQILVPIVPPNTLITISAGPIAGDYGQIVYGAKFGPNMVPDAFTGFLQISGTRPITGTFTVATLNTEFYGFNWVTSAEPTLIYLRNVSRLNQFLEVDYLSLRISSEDDFKETIDLLKHLATSRRAEQLAEETNALLRMLTGGPPAPEPSIRS